MVERIVVAMNLTNKAQQLIAELDKRNINPFVSLAKAGLFFVSGVCLFIISLCSMFLFFDSRLDMIPNIVGAAQALTVICLSVMAWHGYKGSQALYLLRHWKDSKVLDSAPEQPKP
jgi:hypothetical protein